MNSANYTFQAAGIDDASSAKIFLNGVIAYSRHSPSRETQWKDFTSDDIVKLIHQHELYLVTPRQATAGPAQIHGAVILNQDFAAWPEAQRPDRPLHFSKFCADPALKGFGRQVLWPLMMKHARMAGYATLLCEAFPVEGLRRLYLTLGMHEVGSWTYQNSYYGTQITADRYIMPI